MSTFRKILKSIWYFPRFVLSSMIVLYQHTLSLDHGPLKKYFPYGYCKYKPTCSEYCKQAVEQKGVIVGSVKCIYRVLRCNPCSKGGYDPVNKINK